MALGRDGMRLQPGVLQRGRYGRAIYDGQEGQIIGLLPNRAAQTNIWWWPNGGDTEFMFSRRADGVWRRFPGPADGPGLQIVDTEYVDV